jgi:hypothetical protein
VTGDEKKILLKKVEALIREYRLSIDTRKPDKSSGLIMLEVFLIEQRAARLACDDLVKKLRSLYG